MNKMDPVKAEAYFRIRTTMILIYLAIGVFVGYGSVLFARDLSSISVMGIPLHYYVGAQGAVATFIILLFTNAIVSDVIDRKFGISSEGGKTAAGDEAANQ